MSNSEIFNCSLGTVTGLCGMNCCHWCEPFIKDISVRKYMNDQLEEMIREEK